MILGAKVDRRSRVVDWRRVRVGPGDSASRSSNDLTEVLDFVVGKEPDFFKGIQPLVVNDVL